MAKNYLHELGHGFVSVSMSRELYTELHEYLKDYNETKINFLNQLLSDFLKTANDKTRYFATRSELKSRALPIWIDPKIFEELKNIAKNENLSLRAICYTAIVSFVDDKRKALCGNVA